MINESYKQSICESDRLMGVLNMSPKRCQSGGSKPYFLQRYDCLYAYLISIALFASLSVYADVESRPASGIDQATIQDEFLYQALQAKNSGLRIEALQASQANFLARVDVPPNPKKLGLVILVDRDAELLSRNLASALHFELGLLGWPVIIVSTEALQSLAPEDQLTAGQEMLKLSVNKLSEHGASSVTVLLSSFAQPITQSIAQSQLDVVSGVVSLNRHSIDIDKLPDQDALSRLNVAGVRLLDLAPQSLSRKGIAMRKQTLQRAGFSDNYDLLFKPQLRGDAQYTLIAKRLRAWMLKPNS